DTKANPIRSVVERERLRVAVPFGDVVGDLISRVDRGARTVFRTSGERQQDGPQQRRTNRSRNRADHRSTYYTRWRAFTTSSFMTRHPAPVAATVFSSRVLNSTNETDSAPVSTMMI